MKITFVKDVDTGHFFKPLESIDINYMLPVAPETIQLQHLAPLKVYSLEESGPRRSLFWDGLGGSVLLRNI